MTAAEYWPSIIKRMAVDVKPDPNAAHACVKDLSTAQLILFETAPWVDKRKNQSPVNLYPVSGIGNSYVMAVTLCNARSLIGTLLG